MADAVFDCEEVFGTDKDIFDNEEDRDAACMDFQEGTDDGADHPVINRANCEEDEADRDNHDYVCDE